MRHNSRDQKRVVVVVEWIYAGASVGVPVSQCGRRVCTDRHQSRVLPDLHSHEDHINVQDLVELCDA